ncbi:penicillin-binding protein activator [Marinobacterium stanieri]|uniref:penicillin-binding protein activator n=1 Tax=Marinobacterium stanieri TaxID=49186 RepID=UPI003A928E81
MTAIKVMWAQWALLAVLVLGSSWLYAAPDAVMLRDRINANPGAMSSGEFETVWQQLQGLSTTRIIELSSRQDNNYFEQGWFELAKSYRLAASGQRQQQLEAWRRDWFHHPAVAWLERIGVANVLSAEVPARVRQMGVLLPLSGPLAEQGQAVLEGIRAAQNWDKRRGFAVPQLQVFDSQTVVEPTEFIRQAALRHELDLLVGPMQQSLSTRLDQPLAVPVLTLNRSGGRRFNGFQLDLASDQELRQLVELMRREGQRRVLVLAPADEGWVEPLLLWLGQQMRTAGLRQVGPFRFGSRLPELRRQLGSWLAIKSSQNRADNLGQVLSGTPQFIPRRRQDIDAVLLIARPWQARLLKPVLNYHHANTLPTYGSSHVFEGTPDPVKDRDLEGIRFCDMPWRLLKRSGPVSSSVFFALGVDAGSIHRALPKLRAGVPGYFEGETGNLRLWSSSRLERTLLCARFTQGVPEPYMWGDGRSAQ